MRDLFEWKDYWIVQRYLSWMGIIGSLFEWEQYRRFGSKSTLIGVRYIGGGLYFEGFIKNHKN